jgi:peptidoglycan/xylan/chitin deacetylase (PgdA/CDA1 family)
MAWRAVILIATMLVALATAKARAADCPGNPNALGTSRVLAIEPRQFPRIGTVQYQHSLPLEDREVVLTFDDGPLPPYTNRVLETLAEHCVKANYFLVGRMARGYPDLTRRILAEGHTIGTHSENHMLGFDRAPIEMVKNEIERGIASVSAALGQRGATTSFFRIPGFLRRQEVEVYLQSRHLATWSADVVADDWKHISASEVVRRAISRLEERGKGVLLLHDIQPATALALPELLRELKAKGFRIVLVVPGRTGTVPMAAAAPVSSKASPPIGDGVANSSAAISVPMFPARTPPTVAVAKPEPMLPAIVPRKIETRPEPVAETTQVERPAPAPERATSEKPVVPASAAESMARGEDIPVDPARPLTSGARPSRTMPTPDKFVTTEPGGWPPTVSVPVPTAGGIGVSSRSGVSQTRDGRFLSR